MSDHLPEEQQYLVVFSQYHVPSWEAQLPVEQLHLGSEFQKAMIQVLVQVLHVVEPQVQQYSACSEDAIVRSRSQCLLTE